MMTRLTTDSSSAAIDRAATAWMEAHTDAFLRKINREEAKAVALKDLSYADLIDLETDFSEAGLWFDLDDIRHEMNKRETAAKGTLILCFHQAIQSGGALPWIEGAEIGTITVSAWLDEGAGCPAARKDYTAMLMEAGARDRVLAALAVEYAADNVADLLRAGWNAN